ncbi:MAG TPA: DUF5996 family protein [Solirubrobacteraceae bacterium]|nr:DUF5996 family protein [Solirubrobacteraceae bacterium]
MSLWPELPYDEWKPTKETLHRYAQMIGKIRMALVPPLNHWWHVTLLVSARGITTGPMPFEGRTVEIELDVLEPAVHVRTSDGRTARFALHDGLSCAAFHERLDAALGEAGVVVPVPEQPYELGDSPPFPDDTVHDRYDAEAVVRWWDAMRRTAQVLDQLRSGFVGKASPVHLFWHSFDLAHARYSGRPAPLGAGVDPVTAEAYSHEVIAFGWWPGDERQTPYPAFYSYTAPEPDGLRDAPLAPAAARWQDTGNGSLALLAYDDVRTTADPAKTLLAFYESAYRAGAAAAGWDVEALARRMPA